MWGPAAKGGKKGFGPYEGGGGKGGGWVRTEPKPENSWKGAIPNFRESLLASFEAAGVTSAEVDMDEMIEKCQQVCQKQAKKFYNDERANTKMTAAQARAFVVEFVEAIMGGLSTFLYDKPWFANTSWNGALLAALFFTFREGKVFTRCMKADMMPFIDDGILIWSEEERITRCFWAALEAGGVSSGNHTKKANQHLMKAYDDAHFQSPYGSMADGNGLSPEQSTLQEFVKGWMTIFAGKAYNVLESGTKDGSPSGQVEALTAIFQTLLDHNNPCVPINLQGTVPPAPWAYVEQCATEVVSEMNGGK